MGKSAGDELRRRVIEDLLKANFVFSMPWKVVDLFTTIIDGTDNIRAIREEHVVIRMKSGKAYESDKDNL